MLKIAMVLEPQVGGVFAYNPKREYSNGRRNKGSMAKRETREKLKKKITTMKVGVTWSPSTVTEIELLQPHFYKDP